MTWPADCKAPHSAIRGWICFPRIRTGWRTVGHLLDCETSLSESQSIKILYSDWLQEWQREDLHKLALLLKQQENRKGSSAISEHWELSLRKNWKSSVQERLLNLGKTVGPVTFHLGAPSLELLAKAGGIATIRESRLLELHWEYSKHFVPTWSSLGNLYSLGVVGIWTQLGSLKKQTKNPNPMPGNMETA